MLDAPASSCPARVRLEGDIQLAQAKLCGGRVCFPVVNRTGRADAADRSTAWQPSIFMRPI